MAINKVVYGNNVLVDLTNDTVSPENLQSGATAHSRSGALIRGTASMGGAAPCTVLLAAAFDTAIDYNVNDHCIYNGGLYRFIKYHPAGAWNNSHAIQVVMSEESYNWYQYLNGSFHIANKELYKNTVIITSKICKPGSLFYYDFKILPENNSSIFIGFYDNSGSRITYIGKGASSYVSEILEYKGFYELPSNFSYAIVESNDATQKLVVNQLYSEYSGAKANNQLSMGMELIGDKTIHFPPGSSRSYDAFNLSDVKPGDKLHFIMRANKHDIKFVVSFEDSSNNTIATYGKYNNPVENSIDEKIIDVVVPNNFYKAIYTISSNNQANDMSVTYTVYRMNHLYDEINNIIPYIPTVPILRGTFNTYGTITLGEYNTAVTSVPLNCDFNSIIKISCPKNVSVSYYEWDEIGEAFISNRRDSFLSNNTYINPKYPYQLLSFGVSGRSMTDQEIAQCKVEVKSLKSSIKRYTSGGGGTGNILSSTGDSTDRSSEISDLLNNNSVIELGTGDFYIEQAISVPTGCTIKGQGDNTRIITSSNLSHVFSLTTDCTVESMKIVGPQVSTPNSFGNYHAISILQRNSNNRVNKVSIEGFSGAGIYSIQTYENLHNSNTITDCRFNRCGCGIYIGTRSEAFSVSNCTILNCYIGIHCIGGNNRIIGCLMRSCTYGFDMSSTSTTDNDGHSTFMGLVIIHNTHAIRVTKIENGAVFNGCTIYYGDISIDSNSKAMTFNGCEFGSVDSIDGTGSIGSRILNSVFNQMQSSVVTGISLINCITTEGSPFS